jgi:NAD-dependent dihydropyrimidine dehydrogenase PreA subunit
VLAMEGMYPVVVKVDACTGCLQCELLCPDFAIEVD